jgi:hypothetical protein
LQSKITCLWKDPSVTKSYRMAVSLHGHTNRSKEGLTFIPKFIDRHTALQVALAAQKRAARRRGGVYVDFAKAYWNPPLPPLEAFQLELGQIEGGLGLAGVVSLTDHDNIEAPMLLRVVPETRHIPISVEWTVPYGGTIVHLGIHNLPRSQAEAIMEQLAECTANCAPTRLRELLAMLHDHSDVLIALNHPLWDLGGLGKRGHERAVHDFAAEFGMFVHAFELSGVRNWEENRAVLDFAEAWNQSVVGGGDRHGAEPNAVLNLTDAGSFAEFIGEVRRGQRSHVLFMPQYAQPYALRVFQSLLDVVRDYPGHPSGTRRWDERVFHPGRNGDVQPLAALWRRPPVYITGFFALVRMLEVPAIRNAVRAALAKPAQQMHFNPNVRQETSSLWNRTYASRISQTPATKSTGWRTPAGNLRCSRENVGSPS